MSLRSYILWSVVGAFALLFFVFIPGIPYGETLPRFALFQSAIFIAGAFWALALLRGEITVRGYSRRFYMAFGAFGLFALTLLMLSFFQENVLRNIMGDAREVLGVVSLALSALLAFIIATSFRKKEWKKFRFIFIVLSSAVAIIGLGEGIGLWGGGPIDLPFAVPSDLILVMIIAVGFAYSSWRDKSHRMALVLPLIILFAVVGVLASLSFADQLSVERTMMWSAAKEAFNQRSWIGWGVAGLSVGLNNGFNASTMVPDSVFALPLLETSHSGVLAALVRGGIIGALTALLAIVSLFIAGFKGGRGRGMVVAFLVFLAVVGLFVAPSVLTLAILALFAGWFLWEPSNVLEASPQKRFPFVPAAIFAVIIVGVLGFVVVPPLQAVSRIQNLGENMTFARIEKVKESLKSCRCFGGNDLRIALAEAVVNGKAFSRDDAVVSIDFAIEEINRAEEVAPSDPVLLWRHQQLLTTKIAFIQNDNTVNRKVRQGRVMEIGLEGVDVYKRAIAIAPNHPEAYIQRGILAFLRGFYLQADKDFFSSAIGLMKQNARARWSRGLARERYGFWSGARGDLLAATDELEFNYHNPRDFAFLVEAFSINNDTQSAERFALEWVREFAKDANAHFEYAKLLEARGAESQARAEFGEAYRIDPSLRDTN